MTSVTVPDSVTNIGAWAFFLDGDLTNVTLGRDVGGIGNWAFSGCVSLNSITISNRVGSIGVWAFEGCSNLANVTIGDSVTNIGDWAFAYCTALGNVAVPAGVTHIGAGPFGGCSRMAAIVVDTNNPDYTSLDGVLFDKTRTTLIQYPAGKAGTYTVPNTTTNIGELAFASCTNLTGVYFQRDAPGFDSEAFAGDIELTVYYLPGTTGWSTNFAGCPTALWNPQVKAGDASFGVKNNQFGFSITATNSLTVMVEASTNLANPAWSPLQTLTLTNGSAYFNDPQRTSYPTRFYRLTMP
ncbi:MAG: leucine-rich repeat domain-containing protein [Limisphaerales bacterium]